MPEVDDWLANVNLHAFGLVLVLDTEKLHFLPHNPADDDSEQGQQDEQSDRQDLIQEGEHVYDSLCVGVDKRI